MRPMTRQILDVIDRELATGSDAAQELWDVLSALRGPDIGDTGIKEDSTIPIRRAAFPETAAKTDDDPTLRPLRRASFGVPERYLYFYDYATYKGSVHPANHDHLGMHAFRAADVLAILPVSNEVQS
jgi:hypothetical protein